MTKQATSHRRWSEALQNLAGQKANPVVWANIIRALDPLPNAHNLEAVQDYDHALKLATELVSDWPAELRKLPLQWFAQSMAEGYHPRLGLCRRLPNWLLEDYYEQNSALWRNSVKLRALMVRVVLQALNLIQRWQQDAAARLQEGLLTVSDFVCPDYYEFQILCHLSKANPAKPNLALAQEVHDEVTRRGSSYPPPGPLSAGAISHNTPQRLDMEEAFRGAISPMACGLDSHRITALWHPECAKSLEIKDWFLRTLIEALEGESLGELSIIGQSNQTHLVLFRTTKVDASFLVISEYL